MVLQVGGPAEGVAGAAAVVPPVLEGVRAAGVAVVGVLNLQLLALVAGLLLEVVVVAADGGEDVVQLLILVVARRVVVADGEGAALRSLADRLAAADVCGVLPDLNGKGREEREG